MSGTVVSRRAVTLRGRTSDGARCEASRKRGEGDGRRDRKNIMSVQIAGFGSSSY